ncbi:MAG: heparan-alpha-glucosaminide N-acetyltransferase domain-containing protein [Ignavibacteriales bacterium]|nr:heparan-alpha-glucosaminide N-acetyltransferase domain-containing protein [Ignavibacteriales bacterium]
MENVTPLATKDSNSIKTTSAKRIESIDILRGIVMIIMALDHTRDFISVAHFNPVDLSLTTPAYFFTRWITHFCAPVFVFLAGTSAFLYGQRGKTKREVSRFLITRGLWLMFLELTIVRFGWQFNWEYTYSWVQVIWVLGVSMIVLAGLIHFSIKTITAFGLSMIIIHNLFDKITPDQLGIFGWSWQFLHYGGLIQFASKYEHFVSYPLIPWIGVMAVGYSFGTIILKAPEERNKILFRLGLSITITFLIVRGINIYGDPRPWTFQKNFLFTIMSFLNCEKYPPSLSYLLMTLGPAIISLVVLDRIKEGLKKIFLVFGRTPLLFYLVHVPVIHLAAVILALIQNRNIGFMFDNSDFSVWPNNYGLPLPGVYIIWLLVVVGMYPLCKWYADLKGRSKNKWLSYL